jgi:hypothetical protein
VQTALQNFLLSVPQAAATWLIMLAVALTAAAAFTTPGRQRPDGAARDEDPRRPADPLRPIRRGLRPPGTAMNTDDDRAWSRRYADEVAVAADRATVTARRTRLAWEGARDAVEDAWQAFDLADRAATRAAQAAAFALPPCSPTAAELADRERYLHRTATAACRRHELSIRELNDVLAHRRGWDPRLPPGQQEALLRRAVRNRLFVVYREADRAERVAWHAAGVASAAMCSLRAEARSAALLAGLVRVAAEQAWWAEQWTTSAVRQDTPAPEPADVDTGRRWTPADDEATQPIRIPEQMRPDRRRVVAGAR